MLPWLFVLLFFTQINSQCIDNKQITVVSDLYDYTTIENPLVIKVASSYPIQITVTNVDANSGVRLSIDYTSSSHKIDYDFNENSRIATLNLSTPGSSSNSNRVVGTNILLIGFFIFALLKFKITRFSCAVMFLSFILYQTCLAQITCTPNVTISVPSSLLNYVSILPDKNAIVNCTGAFLGQSFSNGTCLTFQKTYDLLWTNDVNSKSCQEDVTNLLNNDNTISFGSNDEIAVLSGKTLERLGKNKEGSLYLFSDPTTLVEYIDYYYSILFLLRINKTTDFCSFIFGCQDCTPQTIEDNICVIHYTLSEQNTTPSCLSRQNCTDNFTGNQTTRVCRTIECGVTCTGAGIFDECHYCKDSSCYNSKCSCYDEVYCKSTLISAGVKLEIIYGLLILFYFFII